MSSCPRGFASDQWPLGTGRSVHGRHGPARPRALRSPPLPRAQLAGAGGERVGSVWQPFPSSGGPRSRSEAPRPAPAPGPIPATLRQPPVPKCSALPTPGPSAHGSWNGPCPPAAHPSWPRLPPAVAASRSAPKALVAPRHNTHPAHTPSPQMSVPGAPSPPPLPLLPVTGSAPGRMQGEGGDSLPLQLLSCVPRGCPPWDAGRHTSGHRASSPSALSRGPKAGTVKLTEGREPLKSELHSCKTHAGHCHL